MIINQPRAVVAGGAGFIGSHVCDRLLSDGYAVECIDDLSTGSLGNISHLRDNPSFIMRLQDISAPFEVDGDISAIFNLASPASPLAYARLPLETLRAGSIGVEHLLQLATAKNARIIFASTSEVYGDPLIHPQPETYWGNVNPTGPRSVYDEAKRYGEAITAAYHRELGVDVGVARLFNCYGPRMNSADGRAVPTFIRQALHGEPLSVSGNGGQTRSLCYVADVVDGLLSLLGSKYTAPVNLGTTHEVSMLELANLIIALVGARSGIRFVPRPVDDPEVRQPVVDLARRILGWEPAVSLTDGLALTVAWFARQKDESPARTALSA